MTYALNNHLKKLKKIKSNHDSKLESKIGRCDRATTLDACEKERKIRVERFNGTNFGYLKM